MPGGMGEVPRQLVPAKHASRRAIYFGGSHSRTNRGYGGLLRFQYSFIEASGL